LQKNIALAAAVAEVVEEVVVIKTKAVVRALVAVMEAKVVAAIMIMEAKVVAAIMIMEAEEEVTMATTTMVEIAVLTVVLPLHHLLQQKVQLLAQHLQKHLINKELLIVLTYIMNPY
jgi:hypothetical protein